VDLYWTTLIVHLTRAVIATGDISSRDALTEMIGVLAVATIPAYRTVSQLCSGTRLDDRATLEDCRAAAWALQRGDTVITEMEGAHIAQRLWSEDSPQWLAASEARHTYEYAPRSWRTLATMPSRTIAWRMISWRCAPTIIANRMSGSPSSWQTAKGRCLLQ